MIVKPLPKEFKINDLSAEINLKIFHRSIDDQVGWGYVPIVTFVCCHIRDSTPQQALK